MTGGFRRRCGLSFRPALSLPVCKRLMAFKFAFRRPRIQKAASSEDGCVARSRMLRTRAAITDDGRGRSSRTLPAAGGACDACLVTESVSDGVLTGTSLPPLCNITFSILSLVLF